MAKKTDRKLLESCANEVLSWLALQDPMYAERIQITKDELHLDNLQTIALYCAYILDNGYHMVYREYPFMAPGYSGHLGPRPCSICNVEFSPQTASDEVCGRQSCLNEHVARLDREYEDAQKHKK